MTWERGITDDNDWTEYVRPEGNEKTGSWITKDSGERYTSDTGYQRDTESGKPRYDLMFALGIPYREQMLTRVASLLARGAEKYDTRNWERADGQVDLDRFKSSAIRHLIQWMTGEVDEDHGAAVIYNIIAHESIQYKIDNGVA